MREKTRTLTSQAQRQEKKSPSSDESPSTSKAKSPTRSGLAREKPTKRTSKKVKFTTPPKYKTKHSISGMVRKNRTALQTLQPAASNPRLLVGSGSPRIAAIGKHKNGKGSPKMKQLTVTSGSDSQLKPSTENESVSTTVKATLEHRAVQTEDLTDQTQSIDYRMCTDVNPPKEYWRVLAEQRRLALVETLEENEQLHDEVERLKAQVRDLENQVKDTSYFAMMYKLASSSEPEVLH